MSDLSHVFKAYDIRGLAPEELTPDFARRLGKILASEWKPKTVMVGRDMRSTSPGLEEALVEALTASGVNVVRIGLCSTPMFNVNVGLAEGKYDLGVMITASHNPAQYNGFKLVRGDVSPIGMGSGMEVLKQRFTAMRDEEVRVESAADGVEDDPNALTAYLEKVFSSVDLSHLASATIAVDAGNGMGGVVLPELSNRLPQVTIHPLYWEPDGTFPNHEANPLKTETLVDLSALVHEKKCAFGVAFDGDADRVGFVDENGEPVPGDLMTAIFARILLRQTPGAKILYDLRSSWSTPETIREAGGTAEMCRVGHAFIKRQMREEDAMFAGELSMHFYFRDLWNVESGDRCLLLLLQHLTETGASLSSLWKPLKHYAKTEELNSEVKDQNAVFSRIDAAYAKDASAISYLDGVRMEFGVSSGGKKSPDAWWFSARASNTEPVIRLVVEAVQEDVLAEKRDELLKLIRE